MVAVFALLVMLGCETSMVGLGGGEDDDARFVADVYTWYCEACVEWTGEGDEATCTEFDTHEGVYSYDLRFEYAPDALTRRRAPDAGCSAGIDMFPRDAGSGGHAIPGVDAIGWENGGESGSLPEISTGMYYDDVYDDVASCASAGDLLGEGTQLTDAGAFSGARAPKPGSLANVTIPGEDRTGGVEHGAEVTVTWDAEGWDESWIQLRRETFQGELQESVTCATGGEDSYAIGSDAWELFSSAVEPEVTNLYVVVQNRESVTTEDGQSLEAITRAVHAAVVR